MFLNRVELIGFLGSDAEAKYTPTGTPVTNLSIATKTTWMQGGDRHERTEWHKVQVWSKLAEYAADFRKGAYLRIVGELRTREYDGQNGHVQTYEIVAQTIQSLRTGQRASTETAPADEAPAEEAPAPESPAEEPPAEPAPAPATRKRSRRTSGKKAAA